MMNIKPALNQKKTQRKVEAKLILNRRTADERCSAFWCLERKRATKLKLKVPTNLRLVTKNLEIEV